MPAILPVGFAGAEAFLVTMVHGLPEQVCAIFIRFVVTTATIVTIAGSGVVVRITLVVMLTVVPKCYLLLTFTFQIILLEAVLRSAVLLL